MKIICVIGMGRSGTSLLCQVLDKLGVYFGEPGELLAASPNNERGYFEHAGINGVLNGMLAGYGVDWLTDDPIPDDWAKHKDECGVIADHLANLLERIHFYGNGDILGFKNPRTALFLPLFKSVFASLDLEPVYLRCLRDPREVYASIRRVQSFEVCARAPHVNTIQSLEACTLTLRECYGVWSNYYIASQAVDALDVWYEDWFRDQAYSVYQLSRIAGHVGLDFLSSPALDVIDPGLRHAVVEDS